MLFGVRINEGAFGLFFRHVFALEYGRAKWISFGGLNVVSTCPTDRFGVYTYIDTRRFQCHREFVLPLRF